MEFYVFFRELMQAGVGMKCRLHHVAFFSYYSTENILYDVLGRFGTDMQQNILQMDNTDNNLYTELGWNRTFGISVEAAYRAMPVANGKVQCAQGESLDKRE